MDYLFENLGDERFQEFCSCLISKEFPNIQAFPVGQPDGGRDSIVYNLNNERKEFVVFQVKFVRNPNKERDVYKWLADTINGEANKITQLAANGAISYHLLTNVRGTAHLDSGSKDKINKLLEDKIPIPAVCWWRDDLSILFEKDPLFKWSFPQILNGQDILNSVIFNNLQEDKERRENVLRSYLKDQYEIDNEVKFKQIDLKNRLLDLFTDVPIKIKKINLKNKALKYTLRSLGHQRISYLDEDVYYEEGKSLGAAEFLLHPKVQSDIQKILLEGGPGQGKSTISQYVCQIHRIRLLEITSDIDLLPSKINQTPIRLPFKIDLRDVAFWIEKKNPYLGILSQEYFDLVWKKSLESFLVAHIFYHSKIEEFTSNDFISLCKNSPALFVFDGFDEIADIKLRSEVIEFINLGIGRLSINIKSIQVIITSRPAAFSDSVGFSTENYPHFELTDITLPIITEYVEKWIKAGRLESRDANDLRKLIKDKLEMPHLKDLAKSPMQLAILISLLRTKGQSLPNKRTALYDSYIELFFDRESEKNYLIRDKRDLIIDIHQYLAWVLHSEAELFKNNGSIHIDDLNKRLKDYLRIEGHDTLIADQLFNVMKERVCALVSRVQGTFEFEVQPLREYFCAKHLYKSAPHSSAGSIKNGTKPDRLYAILRNPYWQNVVRFFAGCADAGELDMIIHELKELQEDKLLKFTNYPRIITAQILSDYVFTQKPHKLKDVVMIIVDGINIGKIINQDNDVSFNEPLLLPNECGRKEIIDECFLQLSKFPNMDYSNELISIINNNPLQNLEKWNSYVNKFDDENLTKWLEIAYKIQLVYKIDEKDLVSVLCKSDDVQVIKKSQIVINGNRLDLVDKNLMLKKLVFSGILNNEIMILQRKNKDHCFNFLSLILQPLIVSYIIRNLTFGPTFLNNTISLIYGSNNAVESAKSIIAFDVKDEIDEKVKKFSDSINNLFDIPIVEFYKNNYHWDELIEKARQVFGNTWVLNINSVIIAAIKSKDQISEEFQDLYNDDISLCKRVRYARLKSGNISYWEKQLSHENPCLALLILLTWGTPKTLIQLIPLLSEKIQLLNEKDLLRLSSSLYKTVNFSMFSKAQQRIIEEGIKIYDNIDEIIYFFSQRINDQNKDRIIYENINNYTGSIKNILNIKFQYLIMSYLKEPSNIQILEEIKKMYPDVPRYNEIKLNRINEYNIKIPYEIAKKIMVESKSYPRLISSLAEKMCRSFANEHVNLIGEIAKKQKWFEQN